MKLDRSDDVGAFDLEDGFGGRAGGGGGEGVAGGFDVGGIVEAGEVGVKEGVQVRSPLARMW